LSIVPAAVALWLAPAGQSATAIGQLANLPY
jgi:hypothetical protein